MFLCWVLLSVSRARPVALKHAPPRLPTSKRSQTCRVWQHVHLLAIVTLVVAHHEFPGSHVFFGPAIKTLPNLPGVAACAPARNCDTRRGAPRIYRVARVFRARHQSSKFVWVWRHADPQLPQIKPKLGSCGPHNLPTVGDPGTGTLTASRNPAQPQPGTPQAPDPQLSQAKPKLGLCGHIP